MQLNKLWFGIIHTINIINEIDFSLLEETQKTRNVNESYIIEEEINKKVKEEECEQVGKEYNGKDREVEFPVSLDVQAF